MALKTTPKTDQAELVRCVDGYVARPAGSNHDVAVRQGDVHRADEPVVLAAPHLWVPDASTDAEFAAARAAIYDRIAYTEKVSLVNLVNLAPTLMEAVDDMDVPGGRIVKGSRFNSRHEYVRLFPQSFRVVD